MLSFTTITLALLAAAPQGSDGPQDTFIPARVASGGATARAFYHPTMPAVGELEAGTPVRIVTKRAPWSRIQAPGGFVVWVHEKYVDVSANGITGSINATHVRARPLPSTSQESYPVGQFEKGDAVQVLGRQEEWVQVRAPESLGAWVTSESLTELASLPGEWDAEWRDARSKLIPSVSRPAPQPAVSKPQPAAVAKPQPASVPKAAAAAPLATAPQPVKPAPAAAAPAQAAPLEGSPLQALVDAELGMARMGVRGWNPAQAAQYESTFRSVLATTEDEAMVARADHGLARIGAMREADRIKAELAGRQQHYERQAQVAEQQAQLKAQQPVSKLASPLDRYTLVGWVERKPSVYSAIPHVITRGDQSAPLISRDGRFDLADYIGREVAVMGSWRSGAGGVRVLEIDTLRVVPSKRR